MRPSFVAAWGLVVVDLGLIALVWLLAFGRLHPFFDFNTGDWFFSGLLFMLLFVVLPLAAFAHSCLWAQRARDIKQWY